MLRWVNEEDIEDSDKNDNEKDVNGNKKKNERQ